eukprot:3964567-Alexandrium_andersonii.AAC.1
MARIQDLLVEEGGLNCVAELEDEPVCVEAQMGQTQLHGRGCFCGCAAASTKRALADALWCPVHAC